MKQVIFSAFIIFLCARPLFSQDQSGAKETNCEQVLIQADDEFNAGRFYGLPALLNPCLDRGFSKEQRIRAYLLLTQAYLILDDPIAADNSYLKLLQADPEYVANTARDPIDVYYLSKKFTSVPIFTPHGRIGSSISWPRIIREITTSPIPIDSRNILKIGFQAGLGIDWNLDNNWSLCAEGNYAYKAIKKESTGYFLADELTVVEKQNWLDIPMYIKYSDDSGKIRPFGYAGFAVNLLLSSRGPDWSFKDNDSDGNSREESDQAEILTPKRNRINQSLVFGGGVKYKIGKDFIYVDLRYMAGLSNVTRAENNYYKDGAFDPATPQYAEVSDFFRMDNLSLSFGYIRPIYNPRKKSKPRLSNLFKRKSVVTKENQ